MVKKRKPRNVRLTKKSEEGKLPEIKTKSSTERPPPRPARSRNRNTGKLIS